MKIWPGGTLSAIIVFWENKKVGGGLRDCRGYLLPLNSCNYILPA